MLPLSTASVTGGSAAALPSSAFPLVKQGDFWHLPCPGITLPHSHPTYPHSTPLPEVQVLLVLWLTAPASFPTGYQGSFHSIQNCFPYGDCYRTTEPATSGDGLSGEAHSFPPLRPNGYHSLSTPFPTTGEPCLSAWAPAKAPHCAGCLMHLVLQHWTALCEKAHPHSIDREVKAQKGPQMLWICNLLGYSSCSFHKLPMGF